MRVLIADDSQVTRFQLQALLGEWGYEPVAACDGTQALHLLEAEGAPRLAILDWVMPGLDGIALCRHLRTWPEERYVYILLLTARGDQSDVVAGLEAGADDFLGKPFDPFELKARLAVGRRLVSLHERFVRAATHDALTGLWNQGAIGDLLARELARARRTGTPVGVLLADVDHFKRVNDTHGHLAGNAVLAEVARRLRSVVRVYDAVGRYGGEEFLVVAPGCLQAGLAELAERLRRVVSDNAIALPEGTVAVAVSVGAAVSAGTEAAAIEGLLGRADQALYRAKVGGRNRVELAK